MLDPKFSISISSSSHLFETILMFNYFHSLSIEKEEKCSEWKKHEHGWENALTNDAHKNLGREGIGGIKLLLITVNTFPQSTLEVNEEK